ncbi:MAG: hypothetical protein ABIJ56_15985 [Pseudomonadota bacterium]
MAIASCVCVWPWLSLSVIPTQDSPAHLALVSAMRHLGEEGHVLNEAFTWGQFPAPNSLYYILGLALAPLTGLLAAERIITAIVLLSLPWSVFAFLAAFERNRWFSFLSFPLAVQWVFTEGFMDYCLGIPLVLLALALQRIYVSGRSRRWAAGIGLLGAVIFITHVQTFATWAVGALILHLMTLRPRLGRHNRFFLISECLLMAGPALLLLGLWIAGKGGELVAKINPAEFVVVGLDHKLEHFLDNTILLLHGTDGSGKIAMAWVITALVCWLAVRVGPESSKDAQDTDRAAGLFPHIFLLLMLIFYAIAPQSFGLYYNLYTRMPSFILVLISIIIVPPMPRDRRRRRHMLLAVPLLACVLYTAVVYHGALKTWEKYTDGFWEVLSHAPGRTSLCYYPEERETGFASLTWRHLGQYHTVVNEGLTSFTFANHPGRLIVQKEPGYDFEYVKSDTLKDKQRIKPYDLLLQVGTTRLEEKKYKKRFALIARKNLWSLYQVTIK